MKRLSALVLIFLSLLILFVSCSGDDDDDNNDSGDPPNVEILNPSNGDEFSNSDTIYFSGIVSDAEDAEIDEDAILWSSSIDGDIGTGYEFSKVLSPGEHVIELSYTDRDENTATSELNITVTSIGNVPIVNITSPAEGARFTDTEDITFSGTAEDDEDGALVSDNLTWSSSIDGIIGTGNSFTGTLSIGNHIITLSAIDSDENIGTASIEINVYTETIHELAMISELPMSSARSVEIAANYAFIAAGSEGLVTVDISNPNSPSVAGSADGDVGNEDDVFIVGNFAYAADGGGLRIYDVSNPESPTETGFLMIDGITTGVYVYGNYAYIAAWEDGMSIVDVSDPSTPELAGTFMPDSECIANEVFVDGDYAYLANNEAGLRIIDISDPSNPDEVHLYNTWGEAKAVVVVDHIAYVADGSQGLRVIDVSDPTDPVELARYIDVNQIYDVKVIGNYAFIADVWQGMMVIDISYPSDLRRVGYWESTQGAWALNIDGDYAYLACNNNGFKIIDISAF